MRIKVKVPAEGSQYLPNEYSGKEFEITVIQIKLPDGNTWFLGEDAELAVMEPDPKTQQQPMKTLIDFIGRQPERILIEFSKELI